MFFILPLFFVIGLFMHTLSSFLFIIPGVDVDKYHVRSISGEQFHQNLSFFSVRLNLMLT